MKTDGCTSTVATSPTPICGQVAELAKYVGWNGALRGTDGSSTFLLPLCLSERLSTPSATAEGRLNPGYSTQALLVYLMNAAIYELRKPESRRHHSEFPAYDPKKIAARLGCSADTVRRAWKRLQSYGIVWLIDGSHVRFDLDLLWSLCTWKPESDKPSPTRAEVSYRIGVMNRETRPEVIAEEQARCVRAILNPGCSVEMPLALIDEPVNRGERPDWALQQVYAHFIYKFMPWRDRETHGLRQHFQGCFYQLHRHALKRAFRCGNTKIGERTRQLADGGYILRLVHRGTRPLREGEQPIVWKDKKRFYRLASTSDTLLNVERYVGLCHAKKVDRAPEISERQTSAMAKPHQNARWKSRHEVPMPQEGTLTEENVAEYLDRISLRHNKDAGRQQELAGKAQAAMTGFGLSPQRLGELYALYINTPGLWYQRADGSPEPIRFASRWLDDPEGLPKTLAWTKDNRVRIEREKAESLGPEEVWKRSKLRLVSDAFRSWWIWSPDPGAVSFEPVDGSDGIDAEEDARRLLGYQLGVLQFEVVADLL